MGKKLSTPGDHERLATRQETEEVLNRLLEEGIMPVAKRIAKLAMAGLIPVVIFEPGEETQRGLHAMFEGWRSGLDLIGVSREEFARSLGRADHVTESWGNRIRPEGDIPIFVFAHEGTLLLNFVEGKGYSFEPGSGDSEIEPRRLS